MQLHHGKYGPRSQWVTGIQHSPLKAQKVWNLSFASFRQFILHVLWTSHQLQLTSWGSIPLRCLGWQHPCAKPFQLMHQSCATMTNMYSTSIQVADTSHSGHWSCHSFLCLMWSRNYEAVAVRTCHDMQLSFFAQRVSQGSECQLRTSWTSGNRSDVFLWQVIWCWASWGSCFDRQVFLWLRQAACVTGSDERIPEHSSLIDMILQTSQYLSWSDGATWWELGTHDT